MAHLSVHDEAEGNLTRDHARMCPGAVFDRFITTKTGRKVILARKLKILFRPGVYVLYRDDVPYYVGQANRLFGRLHDHATQPGGRHDLFWNYFSVFVEEDPELRSRIEAIPIAAMPTSNRAKPSLQRDPYPKEIVEMLREIRKCNANPKLKIGETED